jgi:molybdenum cofactor guanylyltransferase
MGRPKAMLPFGDSTLIERIIAELRRGFDEIVIAVAPESEQQFEAERIATGITGVRLIRDDVAFAGPARALMRSLRQIGSESAFTCSCDVPLVSADVALALCAMLEDDDAVIPEVGSRLQPLHAVYHRRCATALEAMLARGENHVGAIVDCVKTRRVKEAELRRIDPELRSCFNVNSPEDYELALRLASFRL